MAKAPEITIQEDSQTLAKKKGNQVDRFAPDPKELVEYTPELATFIVREIGKGRSLIDVCTPEGMPHHVTFLKWCYSRPELAEQYLQAKRFRAHARAEEVEKLTDALDPLTTGKSEAYVTDIKARNLLRLAEIGDPASFSPKLQMQHLHSGSVVNIQLDLSAPQSRQITDIEASQVLETPTLAAPQSGEGKEKGEGGEGSQA